MSILSLFLTMLDKRG